MMTVDFSSETSQRRGLRLPNPPPLLHTRSGNEPFDRPSTPAENIRHGFTSPVHTPQGSPSKNRMPPGAIDLPNVFEKAMKLTPSSPTKSALNTNNNNNNNHNHNNSPFSPSKSGLSVVEDLNFSESVIHQPSGSPARKSNKENRPPSPTRLAKDLGLSSNVNTAALSRQEPYHHREDAVHRRQVHLRGLTPEELEKLQKPSVKRLVNVTQLCMFFLFFYPSSMP